MLLSNSCSDFSDDTRAVSEVVGFILIFALLILLLSINQSQLVPQENSKIEFQHSQEVRNDLVGFRAAVSTAGQSDVSQFPTVTLGTTYPVRMLAVNPPPPTGTLQTTEKSYPITIENESGPPINVPTRFLEYQPRYSELNIEPTYFENSILYTTGQDGSNAVIIEEQNLVTSGNTLKVTALQNDFQQSGTGRITIELYPTNTINKTIPSGNLTVEIPTRLTGEQYWDDAFEGAEQNRYIGVENDSYASGVHRLRLNINTSNASQEFQFNTVGVRSEPSGGAKQNVGANTNTDSSSSDSDSNSNSQVVAVSGSTPGSGSTELEFDIRNDGDSSVTITDFSISTPANQNSGVTQVTNIDKPPGQSEVQIGGGSANPDNPPNSGDYKTDGTIYSLDSDASLSNGGTASVTMGEFNNGILLTYDLASSAANSDLTVSLTFQDGSTQEYYFRVTNVNS